jgi:hypothetical protein
MLCTTVHARNMRSHFIYPRCYHIHGIAAAQGEYCLGCSSTALNKLMPRWCSCVMSGHRITVAGSTIARASLQLDHLFEWITQKARSYTPRRRRRPPEVRISTATSLTQRQILERECPPVRNSDLIVARRAHRRLNTHPTHPLNTLRLKALPLDGRFGRHRGRYPGIGGRRAGDTRSDTSCVQTRVTLYVKQRTVSVHADALPLDAAAQTSKPLRT